MAIANDDKFRVRRPSYQNWHSKMEGPEAWQKMLKFISALDPAKIHGYRIQVNWKREEELPAAPEAGAPKERFCKHGVAIAVRRSIRYRCEKCAAPEAGAKEGDGK